MIKRDRQLILDGLYYLRASAESEATRIEIHLKCENRGSSNRWSRAARRRAAEITRMIERVCKGELGWKCKPANAK